jgi:hypothetical protein
MPKIASAKPRAELPVEPSGPPGSVADVCAMLRASIAYRGTALHKAVSSHMLSKAHGEGEVQHRIIETLRDALEMIERGGHVGASALTKKIGDIPVV